MSEKIPWNKIGRYISGNCSKTEREKIDEWINRDPSHAQLVNDLEEIWTEHAGQKPEWDAEEGWNDFLKSLEIKDDSHLRLVKEYSASKREPLRISRHRKKRHHRGFYRSRVAAAVIFFVLALASLFIYDRYSRTDLNDGESTLVMQEIVAEKGQRSQFKLSDGTKVWLNGGSMMEISAEFNSGIRKVYLEGEAFFNVASDPDRPFVVEAGNSTTRVLGTKFDLKAYPDEDIRLVVEEGKVAFGGIEEKNKTEVTANKMALLSGNDPIVVQNVVDLDQYMGWMEGKLVFKNTSFKDVMKRLERWYGIECNLVDSVLTERTITGKFRNESVSEVLDLITLTMGIDYEIKDGHITFIAKEYE